MGRKIEREGDVRAEAQDRAQVVAAVADVDDLVKLVPTAVTLHERLELVACRENKGCVGLFSQFRSGKMSDPRKGGE